MLYKTTTSIFTLSKSNIEAIEPNKTIMEVIDLTESDIEVIDLTKSPKTLDGSVALIEQRKRKIREPTCREFLSRRKYIIEGN